MTSEIEKSNFYKDLEGMLDWEASDIKSENQKENDVKQNENDALALILVLFL